MRIIRTVWNSFFSPLRKFIFFSLAHHCGCLYAWAKNSLLGSGNVERKHSSLRTIRTKEKNMFYTNWCQQNTLNDMKLRSFRIICTQHDKYGIVCACVCLLASPFALLLDDDDVCGRSALWMISNLNIWIQMERFVQWRDLYPFFLSSFLTFSFGIGRGGLCLVYLVAPLNRVRHDMYNSKSANANNTSVLDIEMHIQRRQLPSPAYLQFTLAFDDLLAQLVLNRNIM